MHAQQMPLAPHPIPPLGALGTFAGPMGPLTHASPAAMLKVPQDLHRDDIKVSLSAASADDRLVRIDFEFYILIDLIK